MSAQDSDGLSSSDRRRLDEYTAEYDDDDSLMPPPVSKQPTPMDPIFDKKNHPALANPQGDAGKGLPLRPTREVSIASSVGVSKLGSMKIASQKSQDLEDEEDTATATAPATAEKPAAPKHTLDQDDDTDMDEEQLTPEEQAKVVMNVKLIEIKNKL